MTLFNQRSVQLDPRVRGDDDACGANDANGANGSNGHVVFVAIPANAIVAFVVIPAHAGIQCPNLLSQGIHSKNLSPAQKKALKNPDSLENK